MKQNNEHVSLNEEKYGGACPMYGRNGAHNMSTYVPYEIYEKDHPEFSFYYNLEELYSKGHKQFAQDFFSRCPAGRGFASITITILHELGHMNTQQKFEGYNRMEAIENLEKNFPNETINFEYFKLPDEKAATDWAIEWLSHPENRKKAKAFEKRFFECFRK
jgi:hypothetical protein